ncbi:PREDICTED: fibroblast growth factor-binding protein 2-like [Poecilia mexicana]|uniref:fibroblast growth factor-binding protein 2-like n=1 Tax=Poecilia mexicana TaxID=48701 RepID=UPI00072EAC65|nr:PREDICTED: fibroblast growth factor-binding protein 2-like [Poecilia mexicana]
MRTGMKLMMLPLLLVAAVCGSNVQSNDSKQPQQQSSVWDDTIRFITKTKDSCTMGVSAAGNFTRLRVSCRSPSQATGRSYYCDFQGQPNQCGAYNKNPRHYFIQMMWELRKLKNACQGAKIYRPYMCRKYSDEAQMTFMTSWPKTSASKPPKPSQEQCKPAVPAVQYKPTATHKPTKPQPQPAKPLPGSASRLATEYCWKSFHGLCSYVIGWFLN